MHLTIPVSKLLDSQLDIGVDPRSGDFTYNIRDIPSRLQYGHAAGNLMLTLQNSAGDAGSSICLRICSNTTADSAPQSTNTSPVLRFAPALAGLTGQSAQHNAYSDDTFAPSIPSVLTQGIFSRPSGCQNSVDANIPYNHHPNHQGPPEIARYQASRLEVPLEKSPQPSQGSSLMSPISEALSLITSGSIFDDSTRYGSPGHSGYTNFQYNADCTYANMTDHLTRSYSSESTIDTADVRNHLAHLAFEEGGEASASCTLLQTMGFSTSGSVSIQNSPVPQNSVSPLALKLVATGVAEDDQSVRFEAEGNGSHQEASTFGASPAASVSISDDCASDSRPQSRQGKNDRYPCPLATCDRVLKSLYTQKLHMKTHISKPRKNFVCTMGCSETFTRHHDRLRHEVSRHGKQCEFSCKRCERFFSSQRMLDRHTCWSARTGPLRWQLKDCNDFHAEA